MTVILTSSLAFAFGSRTSSERLGNVSSGLSRHWETKTSDRIKKRYEEVLRRQRLREEALEQLRQFERRVTVAEREEHEERERRQEHLPLRDLLWVAGAHVPVPQEIQDPGQRYQHRLALWDHDWVDYWRDQLHYGHHEWVDNWMDHDWDTEDEWDDWDEDGYDDFADSDELSQRSRRRDMHGAPKRMQTIKAWVPLHPDGASGVATPHRQKVSAVSHPRQQRKNAPMNVLAQQRREIALARRLREMQRSQNRQSVAMRRASETIT